MKFYRGNEPGSINGAPPPTDQANQADNPHHLHNPDHQHLLEPPGTQNQPHFSTSFGPANRTPLQQLRQVILHGSSEQRILIAHETRQAIAAAEMGDIRRLSPPGLKEELDPAEDEQKNWKGIIIALLVISTICSFILLSIVLLTPNMAEFSKREQLKLEDFVQKGYESTHYNGTWLSNTELLYRERNGSICIYNIATKHRESLIDGALASHYAAERYSISSDHRYLLLVHDVKKVGHHSTLARYTVFDTKMAIFTPLVSKGDDSEHHQFASWVPNHELIIVVHNNNIYLYTQRGELKHTLTATGSDNFLNGVPDMTYEEHIWNSAQGLWMHSYVGGWAILYASIDNSGVDRLPYIVYGRNANDTSSSSSSSSGNTSAGDASSSSPTSPLAGEVPTDDRQTETATGSAAFSSTASSFPKLYTYPYPKPGRTMPRLRLHVAKLNDLHKIVYKNVEVRPVDGLVDGSPASPFSDLILSTEPVWLNAYEFVATWTRRQQDVIVVSRCREDKMEWRCERLNEQRQLRKLGSLVLHSRPVVSPSGDRLFLRLPVSDGAAGTFSHIAMVGMNDNNNNYNNYNRNNNNNGDQKQVQYLTHGQFVVSEIFAYREDLQTVYYAATSMEEPGLRHIYSLKHHNNSNERKIISCISCRVNESCLYNSARFSPDGRHFVLECMGPDFPTHYLMSTDNETVLEVLDDSAALRRWAATRMMPKIRHYSILTPHSYYIRLQLIIPVGVNELDDAKYPLVIETNRLPGLQSVSYQNKLDWSRYLTSRREYITARVDTRGSAYQGDRHLYSVFQKLGEPEIEDLKVALAYIKQLPYVDDSKIAVWGTEYGGYLATAMLANENQVACAVAVSPITSWKNYLSIFSERYMGKPEESFLEYKQTELSKYAVALRGRNLLLVHGTTDRRVNIQHSMQLMKSLTASAVQYRTQLYPDSGSLETWDQLVRLHFYRTMEDFFAKCFQVEEEDVEDDILPITKVIKGRVKQSQQQQQQQQQSSNN